MKLMLKVMLPIIALMVTIMGASNYISYSQSSALLNESVLNNMRSEVDALRRSTETLMRGTLLDMVRTSGDENIVAFMMDPTDPDKVKHTCDQLEFLMQSYPAYSLISVVSPAGRVLATSNQVVMGADLSTRDYFKKSIQGVTALSVPFYSEFEKAALMVVSAPIYSTDKKITGIVYASINLANFYKSTVSLAKIGERSIPMVLNEEGIIVSAGDPSLIFNQDSPYKSMAKNFTNEGYTRAVGMDGKEAIFYYAKEPFSKLTVSLRAFPDELFAGLTYMRNVALIIALVGIMLGILVVYLIQRPVVNALSLSGVFARKIAAGDLSSELAVKRNDEIGALADALRSIPQSLKEILDEYTMLEKEIEGGNLTASGHTSKFTGEFATLIEGTNSIMNRFRAVLEEIPSPVVVLSKELTVTYLNGEARSLVGENYTGKTCQELFDYADYYKDGCALKFAVEKKRSATAETIARPRGKQLDISYSVIPMLDKEGNLLSILELLTDLTSIKKAQRNILDVVSKATDISTRVATASEELTAQVEQVNRGTNVQRDRVGDTATAMEEMNSTVLEVARNAGEAREQAEFTHKQAEEGTALVDRVIDSVNRVNMMVSELHSNMQELGNQAESIGSVMSVISDIADQTNLLALNAAIEAARAGEAGRGFAVVADEVRKLAEKTMGATSEVGNNIQGIQTTTASNINRVAEAVTTIEQVTELARTSGEALGKILHFARTNSALITSIATASEEQSATSEEINRSIDEINMIAGETASGMAESASAIQALSDLAVELNTLLDKLQS